MTEWTTTSAPTSSGCCRSGVANVLSTTVSASTLLACAITAGRSATSSIGFVGLSTTASRPEAFPRGFARPRPHRRVDGVGVGDVDGDHVEPPDGRGVPAPRLQRSEVAVPAASRRCRPGRRAREPPRRRRGRTRRRVPAVRLVRARRGHSRMATRSGFRTVRTELASSSGPRRRDRACRRRSKRARRPGSAERRARAADARIRRRRFLGPTSASCSDNNVDCHTARSAEGNGTSTEGLAVGVEFATVIIIGAGQAGLSAAHHLQRRGIDFVIFDANSEPGGAWQHRWESLTVAKLNGIFDLPGMPTPAMDPNEPSHDAVPRYFHTSPTLKSGTTCTCAGPCTCGPSSTPTTTRPAT